MKATQTYSKQRLHIIDDYFIDISVQKNILNIPLNSLFSMAMRKNKKRGFLFVSKLIGKHIPILPDTVSVTGGLLAEMFMRETGQGANYDALLLAKAIEATHLLKAAITELSTKKLKADKPTLFLGFAETATGIAQAMFSAFCDNCFYVHTTREVFLDKQPTLIFEEEHSHATSHLCYFDNIEYLKNAERIVLIDDEMTTGNTTLNFIKALINVCNAKEFIAVSILDWRDEAQCKKFADFENEYDIKIKCISLMRGNITILPHAELHINKAYVPDINNKPIINDICLNIGEKHTYKAGSSETPVAPNCSDMTGRFGISADENTRNHDIVYAASQKLKSCRKYKNTLCIGTGEYIYIPSKLASGMGDGCLFFSSTLSPIVQYNYEDYPIKNVITYTDDNVVNKANSNFNIYNILPDAYPEVFIISEHEFTQKTKIEISSQLGHYGVKNLNFVYIS
jgi:hypothetical protein